MSIFRFRGGVHPNDKKQQTEHQAIEKLAMPKMLYIPVLQHIGSPLERSEERRVGKECRL